VDLASLLAEILYDVGDAAGRTSFGRAVDLEPFVRRLETAVRAQGGERCGDDRLCLGDAVLVYETQPLVTSDGRALAEQARGQLDDVDGLTLTRIDRPHENVLSLAGSTDEGSVEVRIVAHRGWIFVVVAADETAAGRLTKPLDEEIDAMERS
jgi:hypothetical protein